MQFVIVEDPGGGMGNSSLTAERRKDIQGLRAIAVGSVVLYHAGAAWLPGGYVGVDVFFVISGCLITGLLVAEMERKGGVRLESFYARRIRRLLPAAALVLVTTLIASRILLPPLLFPDISAAAKATSLYLSNMWFANNGTNYLANQDPSPLQHYWSLAVEEQFYIFWPLLLWITWRTTGKRRSGLIAAISVLLALSFLACVTLTARSQPWAFFLLPTRAWELAVGGLLALALPQLEGARPRRWDLLGWAGLAGIVGSILLFNERLAFPGWAAVVPVLGTTAMLAAGIGGGQSALQRLLGSSFLQLTGRISYSLYLWHWPLLVIPAAAWGAPLAGWLRTLLLVASWLFGYATYIFLEHPVQRLDVLTRFPRLNYVLAAGVTSVSLAAASAFGVLPRLDAGRFTAPPSAAALQGAPSRPTFVPTNLRPSLATALDDLPRIYHDGCQANFGAVLARGCVYGDRAGDQTVVLLGDSHAAQWLPAIERLALQQHWRVITFTKSSCPAFSVSVRNDSLHRYYRECSAWRADALRQVRHINPQMLIMSNYSTDYRRLVASSIDFPTVWANGLAKTAEGLSARTRIIVLGDTPKWPTPPNVCLSVHLDQPQACARTAKEIVDGRLNATERRRTTAIGGTFVDTADWLCPRGTCDVIAWNDLIYRDQHHLTATFAAALEPKLAAALE